MLGEGAFAVLAAALLLEPWPAVAIRFRGGMLLL